MNNFALVGFVTGLIGFLIGLLTTVLGVFTWWGRAETKRYAAERDFQHLKNNHAQMVENQKYLIREGDNRNNAYLRRFDLILIKLGVEPPGDLD